jgi:hypothetical protein
MPSELLNSDFYNLTSNLQPLLAVGEGLAGRNKIAVVEQHRGVVQKDRQRLRPESADAGAVLSKCQQKC